MARYVKDGDGDGRPGGGNGKNKDAWGKGAMEGSPDGDHLQGLHDSNDTIDGLGGDDNINGFSGNDTLIGGDGADDITPGQGEDIVDLGVIDDNETPENLEDDTYVGDGYNDTVNIGVDDDPHIFDGETFVKDPYDTISGYEVAEEGTGTEENTFTTHDVIDLDDMGGSLNALVDEDINIGGNQTEGEVVDRITAAELQNVLWVNSDGQLVFDADGNDDSDPLDDDILAVLTAPDGNAAVDGVTVRFEAEIEVVDGVDEFGEVTSTMVDTAQYVAVWDQEDGGWSISIDGGDWMVV